MVSQHSVPVYPLNGSIIDQWKDPIGAGHDKDASLLSTLSSQDSRKQVLAFIKGNSHSPSRSFYTFPYEPKNTPNLIQ